MEITESDVKQNIDEDTIRDWLEGEEGRKALIHAAERICRKMTAMGLSFSAMGLPASASNQVVIDEIRSELSLILLENRSEIQKKLTSSETDPVRVLTRFMFQRLMDRARWSPRNDPFRYLYKMTVDAVRETEGFYLSAKGRAGSLYSLEKESRFIGPLPREAYAALPLPDDMADRLSMKTIAGRKILIRLARRFWREINRLFQNRPVWIELRDLIQWIGIYVPLDREASHVLNLTGKNAPHEIEPAVEPDHDHAFDPAAVSRWAECFSGLLNEKEALAFHLHYGEEMPLKDVAERMGYSGPSGPSVHLKNVRETLHDFAADLRWLSPDEETPPNRLAQRLFKETLTEILKKRFETP